MFQQVYSHTSIMQLRHLFPLVLALVQSTFAQEQLNIDNPVDDKVPIPQEYDKYNFTFSDDFLIGTASAAYQYEGAWNEGGE